MLPNFLVIGCAKAGTTSLHAYLDQHPDVFMSRLKEPGYFVFAGTDGRCPAISDHRFVTEQKDYERLFASASRESVIGESSTFYLDYASPDVVSRIRGLLTSARILTVLRHPVDRSYSWFTMHLSADRVEAGTFRDRFLEDLETFHEFRVPGRGPPHVALSIANRLALFHDRFPAERVEVKLFEDFREDPARFVAEIYRFLGVDPAFRPDTSDRRNTGGVFRSRLAAGVFNRPNPIRWIARRLLPPSLRIAGRQRVREKLVTRAPKLDPDLRAELTSLDVIQREIDDLQALTGHDLSAWR